MKIREIRLRRLPEGLPTSADFEIAEVELPALGAGEVLVRNLWLTVDPHMRGRMTGKDSYIPSFRRVAGPIAAMPVLISAAKFHMQGWAAADLSARAPRVPDSGRSRCP